MLRAQSTSPFATRVLDYAPAPGQFVRNPQFNDPSRALGPPGGNGGLTAGDNSKCVTLGGFGGTITLGFDHPIWANPHNRRAGGVGGAGPVDFIVYGNGFYVGGDPTRRHAECGVIEVSRDDNGNGIPDDAWYLIPGSHLSPPYTHVVRTWDASALNPLWVPNGKSGTWTTNGHQLPTSVFGSSPILTSSSAHARELVWGYADVGPTLLLGDTTATNVVDDPNADPATFYTRPDDPFTGGVDPGSSGGAAIAIRWAVDETSGLPANLDHIDFVRITTAVDAVSPLLGEISTEVSAVADVGPLYTPDWNGDGLLTVADIFAFLQDWFAGFGEAGGGDFDNNGHTTVADIFAFLSAWFGG